MGFVPLCDCAPLILARELGLFEKYGLEVELKREIGWATLRDKILYGELEAAHALAPMVFAATQGWDSPPVSCLTGLVLNLHGNAITLSTALAESRKNGGLPAEKLWAGRDRLVFGIPFLYSAHHFIARAWLRGQGMGWERRTQFVVVPPPQMPQNLRAGHLDAYCVGEPWNTIAVRGGFGRIAAVSAKISALHPEKVLMVRKIFAEEHAEQHELLIAALIEACRYCDDPANRGAIVTTLARREYLNAPADALAPAFGGPGGGDIANDSAGGCEDFTIFSRANANEPSGRKAAWIFENLRDSGLVPETACLTFSLAKRVFRADLFERGLRWSQSCSQPSDEKQPENESISA